MMIPLEGAYMFLFFLNMYLIPLSLKSGVYLHKIQTNIVNNSKGNSEFEEIMVRNFRKGEIT